MPNKPKFQSKDQFVQSVLDSFNDAETEVAERNEKIQELDDYVYGGRIERSLDTPVGHDFTPVNWLKRTVEVHKSMFMSRGFQVISTYDTQDPTMSEDEQEAGRLKIENKKEKGFAEARKRLIDSIIKDNGGFSMWADLAESAGAIGDAAVKTYYDSDLKKFVISPIEAIDNLRVLWARDDFREKQAVAFVYQITKEEAISEYGAPADTPTSPLGQPLIFNADSPLPANVYSNQPMVTVLEITGKIEGWKAQNGVMVPATPGQENEFNALVVGEKVCRVIDDVKKIPKYYLLPNKRQRRRPWGISDITDAAIQINLTYVETLSDWRTVSAKVNFPKYKAFGFGIDTPLPKSEPRKIQAIPLAEGQDLVSLDQGNPDKMDFQAQMEELKEQFVRETGVSRVLFDDPSVTLNSNQALLTSMKPTSDIAEGKKQLWGPVIEQMFKDALETIGQYEKDLADVTDGDFELKVMWPSVMQKEDPVYQQMLLNRFNSNTISLQSFFEQQGESKEEIDRIRDELEDPVTAAILGRIINVLAEQKVVPPSDKPEVKTTVNLRGDLTPQQEANHATNLGFQDGPFPASMGPQGGQGLVAQENADNQGFLTADAYKGGTPINRGADGKPVTMQKSDTNTGQTPNAQVATPANNQPGTGVVSQPGSGATPVSAQGAINQTQQQNGA